MTSAPRVSVLLPVRNGEDHLAECLESLDSQTFRDFEVIAVDDGSVDATPRILRDAAARDPRIRMVHTPPCGIVAALERARREARAPYLARMDADDVALPGRLEAQLRLLESSPEVVCCGVRVRYTPRNRVRDGARRYERWVNAACSPEEIHREVFVECPLPHPTLFMRADAVEAVGGYQDPGWPEDYDLLLRLFLAGGKLARVPEVLLLWREGSDRLSRTHPRYRPGAFRACKVHYLRAGPLGAASEPPSPGRPALIVGAGPVGKALCRALQGAGTSVRAFVDLDPRKIGQEIHGVPVWPVEDLRKLTPEAHGPVVLGAVGQEGVREEIRAFLRDSGWVETRDFWMVA